MRSFNLRRDVISRLASRHVTYLESVILFLAIYLLLALAVTIVMSRSPKSSAGYGIPPPPPTSQTVPVTRIRGKSDSKVAAYGWGPLALYMNAEEVTTVAQKHGSHASIVRSVDFSERVRGKSYTTSMAWQEGDTFVVVEFDEAPPIHGVPSEAAVNISLHFRQTKEKMRSKIEAMSVQQLGAPTEISPIAGQQNPAEYWCSICASKKCDSSQPLLIIADTFLILSDCGYGDPVETLVTPRVITSQTSLKL